MPLNPFQKKGTEKAFLEKRLSFVSAAAEEIPIRSETKIESEENRQIQASIDEIQKRHPDWPRNACKHVGQLEYDLIKTKRLNIELVAEGKMDELTKVGNRKAYNEAMETEIIRAKRSGTFSLIMIDIDNFKPYNDKYGHDVGDEVLKKVASILAENSRILDVVTRYGGEEFAMICPDTDPEGARVAAEKLVKAIEAETQGQKFPPVTISAGYSTFNQEAQITREHELIQDAIAMNKTADIALYQSKEKGRNQANAYVKGMTMPDKEKPAEQVA